MPYLNPSQIAKRWGVDPKTVRTYFRDREGVLKFGSAKRKILRISEEALAAFEAERSAGFRLKESNRPVNKDLMPRDERRVMALSDGD